MKEDKIKNSFLVNLFNPDSIGKVVEADSKQNA